MLYIEREHEVRLEWEITSKYIRSSKLSPLGTLASMTTVRLATGFLSKLVLLNSMVKFLVFALMINKQSGFHSLGPCWSDYQRVNITAGSNHKIIYHIHHSLICVCRNVCVCNMKLNSDHHSPAAHKQLLVQKCTKPVCYTGCNKIVAYYLRGMILTLN